ncbi:MAG: hypothetical protein Q9172_006074 [Xanthocarpia lactea]
MTSLPGHDDRQMAPGLSRNTPTIGLYTLPNELLLDIASYLHLSSQLALSITCQRIRRLLHKHHGLSVRLAFRSLVPVPDSDAPDFLARQRQLYLSLVEPKDTPTLWCSYCKSHQPLSSFTPDMRNTQRHLRRCHNAAALMWICPHVSIDHHAILPALTGSPSLSDEEVFEQYWYYVEKYCEVAESGLTEPIKKKKYLALMAEERSQNQDRRNSARPCNDKYHNVWITPMGVQHIRALRLGSEGQTTRKIAYLQLKQLMQLRHAHICPHLRMSDKQLYQSAKSNLEVVTLSGFRRVKEFAKAAARTRKIQLRRLGMWPLAKHECGCGKDNEVFLSVNRPLAVGLGIDHPRWLNQTVLPEQMVQLEREWKEDIRAFEARSRPRDL